MIWRNGKAGIGVQGLVDTAVLFFFDYGRRARLEGQRIGRTPLLLDSAAIQQERQRGLSLRQIAKEHSVSTATVQRVLHRHTPTTQEHAA